MFQGAALAQVAVASQNEVFGASLAAHLSSLSEGLPRAEEEFSAALADLANTHPQDVGENQICEVFSKGRALVPIELDHVQRVLTTMSEGEAHASHLATQTLASMVIAQRAAYLDRLDPMCPYGPSCREPQAFCRKGPRGSAMGCQRG